MSADKRPPLALTLGEPGGIGPDIALALWAARAAWDMPPFALIGDADFLRARAHRLGFDIEVQTVDIAEAAAVFGRALPVVEIEARASDRPGEIDPANGAAVVESIERAVRLVQDGAASAVVTNPINKAALYRVGFAYPGHTEFLAVLSARGGPAPRPVMMLASDGLRVVPVTIHVPLSEVPALLTTDLIVETGEIVARDLTERFGIARPRLVLAGLNPHAGEGGAIGREEVDVIRPAVERLCEAGIDARGPYSADTMFHGAGRATYDAALAMYHDQALIPIKTIAFDDAVNVTLGLPFVRTSPDHGTALDIAGTGRARPDSLAAALRLAVRMTAREVAV